MGCPDLARLARARAGSAGPALAPAPAARSSGSAFPESWPAPRPGMETQARQSRHKKENFGARDISSTGSWGQAASLSGAGDKVAAYPAQVAVRRTLRTQYRIDEGGEAKARNGGSVSISVTVLSGR